MLQNVTSLRRSAPWPPSISDEHVSCTAPAMRHAPLQILFKCPMPAIVFGNATSPHVLLTFDKVHLPRETTSERPRVVRTCNVFGVLACTFSTSQLPKWVRNWCALYILTWKCASCHSGVHFFDISTSKSGPNMLCFVHFDLEMCFAPQWRALFRHHNFQKWSECEVFCTFSLANVLCAKRRATFHLSSGHMAPHPTNHWKNTVNRDFPTFSLTWIFFLLNFSSLIFFLLLFSSLTLPISAFHLSNLSEVWLLNFLRYRSTYFIFDISYI